jgi:hypothetical protein
LSRRTREGQSQDQIADELRPAIEALLDELDRWLAPAATGARACPELGFGAGRLNVDQRR